MTQHTKFFSRFLLAPAGLLVATAANAHHPMGMQTPATLFEGLLSGLGHPIIGLDHLAFLVVVGLLAYSLKGTSRYVVPLAFVGATVAGTLIHVGRLDLPMTEVLVALSVLGGGVLLLARAALPALILTLLVALFGIFHGYAYGESIVGAEQTPLLSYLVGFSLIQYVLIAGVTFLVDLAGHRSATAPMRLGQGGGLAATVAGGALLAMNLS